MRIRFLSITLVALFFTSVHLLAAAAPTESTAASPKKVTLPEGYEMCPALADIKKDPQSLLWSAPNGWKSFSASFSNHLGAFLGAQWQGVRVGNVSCLYHGDGPMTFPVVLSFNRLVFVPDGGKWGKDLGGYKNCYSHHRKDCLFKPQPAPKPDNIYDTVRKLKSQGTTQDFAY